MSGPWFATVFLAFGLPGHWEWLVLIVLGLLIFGRRLPEVGRSLGRSIVEFKRGIRGIENEIDEESSKPSRPPELEDKPQIRPREGTTKRESISSRKVEAAPEDQDDDLT